MKPKKEQSEAIPTIIIEGDVLEKAGFTPGDGVDVRILYGQIIINKRMKRGVRVN